MAAISRQSSKAPAPHRFVDQFKTRGKHNEIQKRAASSSETGDATKLQPFQRRHARNGPQGTSHSSASQSGFPVHAMQCVGTTGSDWSGPTIYWDKPERGRHAIPPVSVLATPRAQSRPTPWQAEFDRSPRPGATVAATVWPREPTP